MEKFKLKLGVNHCTNEEYHSDSSFLSSSNYKLLLKDPEQFKIQCIDGVRPEYSKSTQNAFDEGTLAHSLILEPETIDEEFAFFKGWKKVGNEWKQFQEDNKGKILISKPQKVRVERWVASALKLDEELKLFQGGLPEHTVAGEFLGIPTKARADYVNIDKCYIIDIKTTSFGTDIDSFRSVVEDRAYDLSAALYCEILKAEHCRDFDFYFYVLGKKDNVSEVYKLSEKSRIVGLQKLMKAANMYKECKKSGEWKKPDLRTEQDVTDYEILEI